MKSFFHPLLRLRLRHDFYAEGVSTADFVVDAEAGTARLLEQRGFWTRRESDGAVIGAEVEGGSTSLLRRSLPGDGLQLILLLFPRHGHLYSITQLPKYQPGRQIFAFDNLRLDPQSGDGSLFLGDAVAGARLGPPIALVTRTLVFPFAAPVEATAVRVRDRFGGLVAERSILAPAPGASEARIDLAELGLRAGRYRAEGDDGAPIDFFYLPGSFERPFAAVELWSRTDHITPDGADQVPAQHRFLDGDTIQDIGDFVLALPGRATRWQYDVVKKYTSNGVTLAELTLESPAADFTKTVTADRAVFTSTLDVALRERPVPLVLKRSGTELLRLPSPRAQTPLEEQLAGTYHSRLIVYV